MLFNSFYVRLGENVSQTEQIMCEHNEAALFTLLLVP